LYKRTYCWRKGDFNKSGWTVIEGSLWLCLLSRV